MAKRKKGKAGNSLIALLVVLFLFLTGYGLENNGIDDANVYTDVEDAYVHFIDVGQGSSTLIQLGHEGILIDAGESDYGDYVAEYINACGIDKLKYAVASHPHSDHIGGLVDVLETYSECEVIMPELTEINTPTTKVYERLLDVIIEKDIPVIAAEFGEKFDFNGISMEILGPVEQTEDLNDMSVICKLNVNGTELMITGDAEKPELSSVYQMAVRKGFDLGCDIITMGHHGSDTSVYLSFLDAVNADVAIVSCGRNNIYGHPHKKALEYINDNDMILYRTDYDGHIVFKCTKDGYERFKYENFNG